MLTITSFSFIISFSSGASPYITSPLSLSASILQPHQSRDVSEYTSRSPAATWRRICGRTLAARGLAGEGCLQTLRGKLWRCECTRRAKRQTVISTDTCKQRASHFDVSAGGAAGTSLLCRHQLGWPPGQEGDPAIHPKSGTQDSEMRNVFNQCTVCLSACLSLSLLQTGPCDISHIDPEFTLQPVPPSVNERCQVGVASEAFPGFSFMNPAEYMAAQLVS